MIWEHLFSCVSHGCGQRELAFDDDVDKWNVHRFEEIMLSIHSQLLGVNYDICKYIHLVQYMSCD